MMHALRVELAVEAITNLASVEADWRRLAARAGNPFLTWPWASAWLSLVAPGGQVLAQRCVDANGKTVGILPLHLSRARGLRLLRLIGHGPADELAPICAPEDRPAVAAAFARFVATPGPWDVCLAERLPAADGWPARLGGRTVRRELSSEVELTTSDWDEFLAGRSSNFRQQARKFERRLIRDHGLRYRLVDDPGTLEEDMETLFRLHDARWGAETVAFTPGLRPFHREVAATALSEGWLRMWFAELDGAPAAVWYGFRLGGADWFYQQGRDPAWERSSVGFVLTAHALRDAVEAGLSRYRFLLGDEEYKSRFASSEPEIETVAWSRGARGAVALAAAGIIAKLPPGLRRLANPGA
jgi:CelD/BcsL family acetyltransferase involved in cellulose biosynthesis